MKPRSWRPGNRDGRWNPGRRRDWLLGTALLLALLALVDRTVGWPALLAPWRALSAVELAALLGLSALSYGFRAARVQDYFAPRFAGRFLVLLRLSTLHNAANNLLPMRAGEMLFPWLMDRYFGHGFARAFAALVWIRLLDLHFLGLVGLLVLYLRDPGLLWPLAGGLWLGLLPGLRLAAGRMPDPAGGALSRLWHGFVRAAPAAPCLSRLYAWTFWIWVTKFFAFALLLHHFLPLPAWQILIGVLGAELSSVLPVHGIAGAGSYEFAVVAALLPFGVGAEAALVGAVNLHLFLLGVTLLLGLAALWLPTGDSRPESAGS